MTDLWSGVELPAGRPALELEKELWRELTDTCDSLTPEEREAPGYFREGWSVKDMLAHVGTWLAEAGVALQQIRAGTYRPEELDIEAMNRRFLEAMRYEPWDIVEAQAWTARARMLREWYELPDDISPEAGVWVRKAGPEHYHEHLPRLREWVGELRGGGAAGGADAGTAEASPAGGTARA